MRRRQMIALLGSVGITSIAGCSSGDNGNSGSDGGNSSNEEGGSNSGENSPNGGECIPENEDLSSLLPPEESGEFQRTLQVTSGVDIEADNYVLGRYEGPSGNENDLLIAEYSSSSAAEAATQNVRGVSTRPVMGMLVDGRRLVAADAQSEQIARDLLSVSDIGCADQLSFSSSASSTQESSLGETIWAQRDADAGRTRSVDVTGPSASELTETVFDEDLGYSPIITENAIIYDGVYDLSGESIRGLPASPQLPPSLVNDTVIIPSETDVVAADVTTGEELWRFTPRTAMNDTVVTEDTVYIQQYDDNRVTAVDIDSGEEVWTISESRCAEGKPLAVGEYLYVGGSSLYENDAYILDPDDGSEVGRLPFWDGSVMIGPSNNLFEGGDFKYNPEGEEVWENVEIEGDLIGVDSTQVYSVDFGYNQEPTLHAANISDGSEVWTFELASVPVPQASAVGDERVYVGTDTDDGGRIYALSKDDGSRQQLYSISDKPRSLAVGDGVFVAELQSGEDIILTEE